MSPWCILTARPTLHHPPHIPPPLPPAFLADDYVLRRFLRARKHDILKAKKMFLAQLE